MKQFFWEVWLSLQPKKYYYFLVARQLSNRWAFLTFLVLIYSVVTGAVVFGRIQSTASFIFNQAQRIILAMPNNTTLVFQGGQLTVKNLPQPYQEKIFGVSGQQFSLLIDTENPQPKLDNFGFILSKTGLIAQTANGANLFSWENLPNQTIDNTQLRNLVAGGWRVALWLVASIMFLALVIVLGIFWSAYIWLWSWLLWWPTKKLGLTLPYSEMVIIITHWCVIPMILQLVFRLLLGNMLIPFLPTALGLLFWLAVIKAWPKSAPLIESV